MWVVEVFTVECVGAVLSCDSEMPNAVRPPTMTAADAAARANDVGKW
jgi:hypothetical protein